MYALNEESVKFMSSTLFNDSKVIIQGKLFQRCTHFLYCSVLSLGGNVNTRRMSQLDRVSIFHIKKSMKYSGQRELVSIYTQSIRNFNKLSLHYNLVAKMFWSN